MTTLILNIQTDADSGSDLMAADVDPLYHALNF